jgi:hypothetical protein
MPTINVGANCAALQEPPTLTGSYYATNTTGNARAIAITSAGVLNYFNYSGLLTDPGSYTLNDFKISFVWDSSFTPPPDITGITPPLIQGDSRVRCIKSASYNGNLFMAYFVTPTTIRILNPTTGIDREVLNTGVFTLSSTLFTIVTPSTYKFYFLDYIDYTGSTGPKNYLLPDGTSYDVNQVTANLYKVKAFLLRVTISETDGFVTVINDATYTGPAPVYSSDFSSTAGKITVNGTDYSASTSCTQDQTVFDNSDIIFKIFQVSDKVIGWDASGLKLATSYFSFGTSSYMNGYFALIPASSEGSSNFILATSDFLKYVTLSASGTQLVALPTGMSAALRSGEQFGFSESSYGTWYQRNSPAGDGFYLIYTGPYVNGVRGDTLALQINSLGVGALSASGVTGWGTVLSCSECSPVNNMCISNLAVRYIPKDDGYYVNNSIYRDLHVLSLNPPNNLKITDYNAQGITLNTFYVSCTVDMATGNVTIGYNTLGITYDYGTDRFKTGTVVLSSYKGERTTWP